jgi:hypothetical protein
LAGAPNRLAVTVRKFEVKVMAEGNGRGSGGFRFAMCALVLAGVVLTLPYTKDAALDAAEWIGGKVDVKSAVRVLGEGISGERGFVQALGDAFAVAFRSGGGPDDGEGGDMEASGGADGSEDTGADAREDAMIPDAAAGFDDAVISAFADTRSEYSDMLIPAGAPRGY